MVIFLIFLLIVYEAGDLKILVSTTYQTETMSCVLRILGLILDFDLTLVGHSYKGLWFLSSTWQ